MRQQPSWNDTWMSVAEIVGRRSRCIRARVGCVIVTTDNRIGAASYAGPPPGIEVAGTCENWCERGRKTKLALVDETTPDLDIAYHDCVASHAESNAIARADWSEIKGGALYVSGAVCYGCAKQVASCGVRHVFMRVSDDDQHRDPDRSVEYLRAAGLLVRVTR